MEIQQFLNIELPKIEGWCSKDKAEKLYNLIVEIKPELCVEIGVFGGSSIMPQALGLKQNKKGTIVAIDPWTKEAALEEMEKQANKDWWASIDMEYIYNHFLQNLEKFGVKEFCKVIRNKSINVANDFADESIDVLHIDGNHCEKMAYNDSLMYLPKVKVDGYIFYDDTTWVESGSVASTAKGLNLLLEKCKQVCIVGKDCVVLKKVKS